MVLEVSPGRTLVAAKETASNRFLFHRACAYTNENFNKTIGLKSKTTTLHDHHAFTFAFLCHFCTTTT